MKTCFERKEIAREKIMDILEQDRQQSFSYSEWVNAQEIFARLAKKYGLIRELQENGIL